MKTRWIWAAAFAFILVCTACGTTTAPTTGGPIIVVTSTPLQAPAEGTAAQVTRIIDGDTIDVRIGEVGYRVRYIGVNTPERDEACYQEASDANALLVSGQTVTLVKDTSNTDKYGRLLRYVYVGSLFVNAELVKEGWAENAVYPPDTAFEDTFYQLEQAAKTANIGCHPSGIFDDGSDTR